MLSRNLTIAVDPINIPTQGCDKSNLRRLIRDKIIELWNDEWSQYRPDDITKILIPTVNDSLHAPIYGDFFLAQDIGGHGCYRSNLTKIGKITDPNCPECPSQIEDALHVLTACPRFINNRPSGEITLNDVWIKYMKNTLRELWTTVLRTGHLKIVKTFM